MLLASIKEAQLASHTSVFLKPVKNQTAWRPVLGVLQLIRVRGAGVARWMCGSSGVTSRLTGVSVWLRQVPVLTALR